MMEIETVRAMKGQLKQEITRLVRDYEERTGTEVTGPDRLTATTMGGLRPHQTTVAITVSVAL